MKNAQSERGVVDTGTHIQAGKIGIVLFSLERERHCHHEGEGACLPSMKRGKL